MTGTLGTIDLLIEKGLYRMNDVSQLLNIHMDTLNTWVKQGYIDSYSIDGKYFIPIEQLCDTLTDLLINRDGENEDSEDRIFLEYLESGRERLFIDYLIQFDVGRRNSSAPKK